MTPVEIKENEKVITYVIYDFESMITADGKHVPNLCVLHKVCADCFSKPMVPEIQCSCERFRKVFSGLDTVDQFGNWVFAKKRKNTICLAHNAKGYDLHFVMDYLHRHVIKPAIIQNGRKIMSLKVGTIKFLDSLNFLPMALSKLPGAFGLKELAKGYFPHLFNNVENQNYKGPIPAAHYYNPDGMSSDAKKAFCEWYETHRNDYFDMQQELLKYCISDVDILQRACGTFRDTFVKVTEGIEPFERAVTIASACNLVYRANFLQPEQIALIPPHGYAKGAHSAIALTWLTMEAKRTGCAIRHAGNYGEQTVEGYKVSIIKKCYPFCFILKNVANCF
jgi:hypothetical protein